ncbi:MAG: translational GTPase TypA [Spirochaetales bacterium]|nr:translational GTPase TypA [Spirochaetales bacterium]MBR6201328.1 translational GTPase TypA [Spirochaetales bacterium]
MIEDITKIRNIAIIAHVDHGKTTMVNTMFMQSGMFRENQHVEDRMMDSMDLERERGITITSKNGSFKYKDHLINIVDTPGHADFGGQVERILNMVDGALLLVDAAEGPMPQTFYVLKKALALNIPIIVVINKIDKPNSRCDWVKDQVGDLFLKLNAPYELLDFPVIYASAREGYATTDPAVRTDNMIALFDEIIRYIPCPKGDATGPVQMLVSTISYSSYLGRLAIGKITSGNMCINQEIAISTRDGELKNARISKLYTFESNGMVEASDANVGEIVAVAGIEDIMIGETITDRNNPIPLPIIELDPPTISMNFIPNDSPFAGQDGKFVTSRHLKDRLYRETLADVALVVTELTEGVGYKVSGRGELHLSILIEKMRREGYEFQITRPEVIMKKVDGKLLEPYEELILDVEEDTVGAVIDAVSKRKGQFLEMIPDTGFTRLRYKIPTRGLLGFKSEFMNLTRGMGLMNYVFLEFDEYAGDIKSRINGVLISMENCTTVAYALFNLQDRGKLFYGPQVKVYEGQIVGEHSRTNDIVVNPGKTKKLTNLRAAGSDENIILTPPTVMTLEKCITYINDDELVEITPKEIRLRKVLLHEIDRRRSGRGSAEE